MSGTQAKLMWHMRNHENYNLHGKDDPDDLLAAAGLAWDQVVEEQRNKKVGRGLRTFLGSQHL